MKILFDFARSHFPIVGVVLVSDMFIFFFLSISNTPDDILEPKQWKKWIEMQNNWMKKTNSVAAFFRGAMLSFCAENTTEMSLVSMQTLAFHTKYQCKSQTNICAIFFSVCIFFFFSHHLNLLQQIKQKKNP